jgi:hypothetical protein
VAAGLVASIEELLEDLEESPGRRLGIVILPTGKKEVRKGMEA